MENDNTVFIGAGQASARCAVELRRLGYGGRITLFGAESDLPYQRPELSKSYLARPASATELNVLSQEQADALNIQFIPDAQVTQVDISSRSICVNNNRISFDKLVFACGGQPRTWGNALQLRTRDDAETLHTLLKTEKKLTVVGGGWLGLEVAATARLHQLDVTLYETQSRLAARSVPEDISQLLLEHQQSIGVDVHLECDTPPESFDRGVVCACIGITPADALAEAAGIDTDCGIIVNERQMTSEPNIFAIGDCAREYNKPSMENWAYANISAERAAHAICDVAPPVAADVWLWSKQGDLLLQMRGDYSGADQCVIRKQGNSMAYFYLAESYLTCCVAINDPALFGQSRMLYRANRKIDVESLSDPRVPLKHVSTKISA